MSGWPDVGLSFCCKIGASAITARAIFAGRGQGKWWIDGDSRKDPTGGWTQTIDLRVTEAGTWLFGKRGVGIPLMG